MTDQVPTLDSVFNPTDASVQATLSALLYKRGEKIERLSPDNRARWEREIRFALESAAIVMAKERADLFTRALDAFERTEGDREKKQAAFYAVFAKLPEEIYAARMRAMR